MFWPDILRLATLADRPAKLAKSAIFLCKIFFFDKKSSKFMLQEFGRKWPISENFVKNVLFGVFRLKLLYIGSLYHFDKFW